MLLNVSYNNPKVNKRIKESLGSRYNFFKAIKLGGTGSSAFKLKSASPEILVLLELDNNDPKINIEIFEKGIALYFRSILETYALCIPFHHLNIFQNGTSLSIYGDKHQMILESNSNPSKFLRKILEHKTNALPQFPY